MKRLTILLDDNIHKQLKLLCVQQDTDMSEVTRKLVEKFVESQRKKAKANH